MFFGDISFRLRQCINLLELVQLLISIHEYIFLILNILLLIRSMLQRHMLTNVRILPTDLTDIFYVSHPQLWIDFTLEKRLARNFKSQTVCNHFIVLVRICAAFNEYISIAFHKSISTCMEFHNSNVNSEVLSAIQPWQLA